MFLGAGFGLIAAALAVGTGSAALGGRGIESQLDGADYVLFLAGGAVAAALWAAIGVGIGAVVRNQVPTLIGICAWLLFVEGLLVGDVAGVGNVGRFAPGAAAAAISGLDPDKLVAPVVGLVLLALYATAAALAGSLATARRDVV
jgi:ABC-2 type transport system permease protein